jgi:putative transposase
LRSLCLVVNHPTRHFSGRSAHMRERHSVSCLTIHLVCVTKYRRKLLDDAAVDWLKGHCAIVCETMGCRLLACDGEADHLHLLLEYPPKYSVSVLVNAIKGTSSRRLRTTRPDIGRRSGKGVLWSPSYFAASTGEATLDVVKQYVEQQRASSSP